MIRDFLNNFIFGLTSYKKAWQFVNLHKMWWYFFIPIFLFIGIYYLGFTFQSLKDSATVSDDDGMFYTAWVYFKKILYGLLALFIFNFMRYIIILMMSPLLSVISERVERILTGNTYKFNLDQLIKDVKRTINLAIRNIIWELGIIAIIYTSIYIFMWSIGLSEYRYLITTPLAMFIAFYYYGFGFIDYINERRRMNIEQSVNFVKKNKGFAVGLGMVFTIIFHYSNYLFNSIGNDVSQIWFFIIVLVIAIITATIPIYTMVAATIGMHELVDLSKNPHATKNQTNSIQEKTEIDLSN
jgi:CysZ protein